MVPAQWGRAYDRQASIVDFTWFVGYCMGDSLCGTVRGDTRTMNTIKAIVDSKELKNAS